MRYLYTLYDAKTGEPMHKGTPAQLIAEGVFNSSEEAARAWGRQHLNSSAPRKWRVEREALQPKKKPKEKTGGQKRKVWFYRMYGEAGQLVCEGTAAELRDRGLFFRPEDAANTWRLGHNARLGVVRVEREKAERVVPLSEYKRREKYAEPKNGMVEKTPCRIKDPDALQLDAHKLCYYNAVARKRGKKELSYGYWALAGKPEEPL